MEIQDILPPEDLKFILGIILLPLFYSLRKRRKPEKIYFETVSKLFKDFKNLKGKNFKGVSEFIKYNSESYITRDSNNKLKNYLLNNDTSTGILLLGESMMGKSSMVFNEIIKNKDKLKRWSVFIPEDSGSLQKWNRKLPIWILPKNKILFIDDLDRFLPIGKQSLSEIIDKLGKKGKLKIIATCRSGDEWKSVESEFDGFFNETIKLETITDQEAEELAVKNNKSTNDFDGTPGSITLRIKRQKAKIENLRVTKNDCYDILNAAALMHHFLWFNIYEKRQIKEIIKYIFNNKIIDKYFGGCISYLSDNRIISSYEEKVITIPDPYLDNIIKNLTIDREEKLKKLEEYAIKNDKNKDILNRLADYYNYNMGVAIHDLARLTNDEALYRQSFEKYEKATVLNPKNDSAFNNWGIAISDLAKLKKDEVLYRQSFEKYEKATALNPKNDSAFNNWGVAIHDLAELTNDEALYRQSFEKYEKATALNPKNNAAFYNWGIAIHNLAKLKNDEALYRQSFEKYEKATALNPKNDSAFNNWGTAIYYLAELKNDEALYGQSFEKLHKAVELGGSSYNLACVYAWKKEKNNALKYLENSLIKKEITVEFVEEDEDWEAYKNDVGFIGLLDKYRI